MSLISDRLGLNSHNLFKRLRENMHTPLGAQSNITACSNDILFVWDGSNRCLLTLSLKPFFRYFDNDYNASKHQALRMMRMPLENVRYIVVNNLCHQVAVVCETIIYIVDLPKRWGVLTEFEGGRPSITCWTKMLAPSGLKETVLKALWHPDSPDDNHLVVLYSDSILRMFDTNTGEIVEVVVMGPTNRKRGYCALGDSAVDFDFSPAMIRKVKRKILGIVEEIVYPILVLWGNGDVLYVIITFSLEGIKTPVVRGPLQMFPPADDNYGSDASAIMVLQSTPPLVVISSCSGTLYHSLMLETYIVHEEYDKETWPMRSFTVEHNVALYMFEVVELELGLNILSEEIEDADATYSCQLSLMKDLNYCARYLCIHETGIHLITLPIVLQLEAYARAESDDISKFIQSFSQYISTVEYMVCTRLNDTDLLPPVGECIIPSPDTLLVVLKNGEVLTLHLPFVRAPIMNVEPTEERKPKAEEPKEGFDDYVKNILSPSTPAPRFPPLLKLDRKSRLPSKDQLEILSKAVLFFRNEVFPRHQTALSEIKKRMKALTVQKKQQEEDLEYLEKSKVELKNKAEQLAEKYEEINDKQMELMKRGERSLLLTRSKSNHMTKAEMKMVERLKEFKKVFDETATVMDKIRSRITSQRIQGVNEKKKEEYKELENVVLSEKQSRIAKSALAHMAADISKLRNRVHIIKTFLQRQI